MSASVPSPCIDPSCYVRWDDVLTHRAIRQGMRVDPAPSNAWRLATLSGRLGELSGSHARASLTLAFQLVLDAQQQGEPVVWITRRDSAFFPPDVAEAGIDLDALAVVRVPEARQIVRAADHLVRSGAFGLVVLDIGENACMPIPVQSRLVGLAKKHDTALLCITEKDGNRPSLGSLVSFHAEAARTERLGERYRCEMRILKDKRRGPGWNHTEICHAPDGLR